MGPYLTVAKFGGRAIVERLLGILLCLSLILTSLDVGTPARTFGSLRTLLLPLRTNLSLIRALVTALATPLLTPISILQLVLLKETSHGLGIAGSLSASWSLVLTIGALIIK